MTDAWKQWEGEVVNGEFHLLRYLGGSEHSAVYLAERTQHEPQKVAIKLISAGPDDAETHLSRWKLAANLSHPHLIRLFQMGRCRLGNEELLYIVMEYAEEDLSQIIPQRPLTPAEARDMLPPALGALAYLHGKGLAHGHVKPANIMAVDNQLKISSDGISAAGESSAGGNKSGIYDSPETASTGNSSAGDIWSLGMTLVETLTQHLPHREQGQSEEPTLLETLPAPFLDIARHCLRRDPQLRWTVGDIEARLQPASPARRPQTNARPQSTSSKWRYVVTAAAVAAVLAAILAGQKLLNQHPEASGAAQPSEKVTKGQPASSDSAPAPVPAHSEARPKARAGSLMQGDVAHQVLPDVPAKARDTVHGVVKVRIRVQVDGSGNVTSADFDSEGPSKYFANLAMKAARQWKFTPVNADDRDAPRDWILRFEFTQAGAKAAAVYAAP